MPTLQHSITKENEIIVTGLEKNHITLERENSVQSTSYVFLSYKCPFLFT